MIDDKLTFVNPYLSLLSALTFKRKKLNYSSDFPINHNSVYMYMYLSMM